MKHFLDLDHELDFSTIASYNSTLSKHLKIILIDQVDFPPNTSTEVKEAALIQKEGYWQTHLKTLERYGGLNILDSRFIANS